MKERKERRSERGRGVHRDLATKKGVDELNSLLNCLNGEVKYVQSRKETRTEQNEETKKPEEKKEIAVDPQKMELLKANESKDMEAKIFQTLRGQVFKRLSQLKGSKADAFDLVGHKITVCKKQGIVTVIFKTEVTFTLMMPNIENAADAIAYIISRYVAGVIAKEEASKQEKVTYIS